jgi:hypothetical protein
MDSHFSKTQLGEKTDAQIILMVLQTAEMRLPPIGNLIDCLISSEFAIN